MHIAIVGLGLIGTSIALSIRRSQPDAQLTGIDRADVIRHPRIVDSFTMATTELAAVADADLIVLATPVDVILDTLPQISAFNPRALVTDTGSTKRRIVQAARDARLARFVGGHPLAGSEQSGPDAARGDLFHARRWFLVGPGEDAEAAGAFVRNLGAIPIFMNDDGTDHDRLMAAVSHLPQVVAAALMTRVGEVVGPEGLASAGAGLRDTTRLAGSRASVWESVLATNSDALGPLLKALASDLATIADHLEDRAAVRRVFGLANMYRKEL